MGGVLHVGVVVGDEDACLGRPGEGGRGQADGSRLSKLMVPRLSRCKAAHGLARRRKLRLIDERNGS